MKKNLKIWTNKEQLILMKTNLRMEMKIMKTMKKMSLYKKKITKMNNKIIINKMNKQ